ncbi:PAS domain S-box protein [Deinococcus multiflagellatus]|uniref:PAS domain S-box protein n=1 Tax=Deinococcus multiflagellatus TaxID=1656887 RepID=A0ABW1ZSN0_9DEIO
MFRVPMAAVTFMAKDRQWFKACVGADVQENARSQSLCQALFDSGAPEVLVVPDTLADPRFRDLPAVTGALQIRFYAGAPLVTPGGLRLGTLCLYDVAPRPDLGPDDRAMLQDLAAHVVSELQLRQATAQQAREHQVHEAVLASAMDAMMVLDAGGRVLAWNPAAEAMLGYSRQEALGRELTEVMVPPDYHEVHRRGIAQVVTTGERRQHRAELPAQRRGGHVFPAEFTVTSCRVDGETLFMISVRDLTQVRAAREALKASHQLLNTVVESVPEAIYVKDAARRYTLINAAGAAQIGRPVTDILGRTDEALFPPRAAQQARARDEAVLASGHAQSYEVEDTLGTGAGASTGPRRCLSWARKGRRRAGGGVH